MYEDYLGLAVKKLRFRSYSRAEIRKHLLSLGADPDQAEAVVERLQELAYLDDPKLAQELADTYRRTKPCGYLLWSEKLRQRGLAEEHIAEVAGSGEAEDRKTARQIATAYLQTRTSGHPEQKLRRLAQHLARRGFADELIEEIIGELQEGNC